MNRPNEFEHELYPLRFESADERPRESSPEGWYPMVANLMVYEDELARMPAGVWFRYFAGGHNGQHFVMRDHNGDFYHVDGAFGSYELSAPHAAGGYPNVYDAFWTAGQQAGINQTG